MQIAKSTRGGDLIENLESRVLLSTTNIVGTFTGILNTTAQPGPGALVFTFTIENGRGGLVGTGSTKFAHSHTKDFTLTGKIRGDGISLVDSDGVKITAVFVRRHHQNIITGTSLNTSGGTGAFSVTEI